MHSTFHFPVYSLNDQLSTVAIIRNIPQPFHIDDTDKGTELRNLLDSICTDASIEQAVKHSSNENVRYGVVRVQVKSDDEVRNILKALDGCTFNENGLTVSANPALYPRGFRGVQQKLEIKTTPREYGIVWSNRTGETIRIRDNNDGLYHIRINRLKKGENVTGVTEWGR